MRKSNKKITDVSVVIGLLNSCHVGRLGTAGADGWPVIKPVNFAYQEGRIYFHCALEGEKLEDIRRDNRVCFEVDLPIAYVQGSQENPCRAEYLYRSVIARGRATIVQDRAEKILALDCLMHKYQPGIAFAPYREDKLDITGIVRIEIEDLSGKEELGKEELQAKALELLASGVPLPVMLG